MLCLVPSKESATLSYELSETDIDQTTFTVHPASVTQVEGMNVVFECLYPNATAYGWAFNGTSQSVFPPDIVDRSPSGDSPATLTIPAIPEYNNTVVHCEAVGVLSESATLKVQGIYSCIIFGIAIDYVTLYKRVVVNGESHNARM